VTVQRYLVLAFLCGAVCIAATIRSAAVNIFGLAGAPDYLVGPLPLSMVLAILAFFITFFGLMRHKKAVTFSTETIREMYKVTWPNRQETHKATTVVVLSAVGSALFLAACDVFWARVTEVLIFNNS
jgi:preprotein translocase SecE subunit